MDRKAKQLVLDSAFASMINVSHSSYSSYRRVSSETSSPSQPSFVCTSRCLLVSARHDEFPWLTSPHVPARLHRFGSTWLPSAMYIHALAVSRTAIPTNSTARSWWRFSQLRTSRTLGTGSWPSTRTPSRSSSPPPAASCRQAFCWFCLLEKVNGKGKDHRYTRPPHAATTLDVKFGKMYPATLISVFSCAKYVIYLHSSFWS